MIKNEYNLLEDEKWCNVGQEYKNIKRYNKVYET